MDKNLDAQLNRIVEEDFEKLPDSEKKKYKNKKLFNVLIIVGVIIVIGVVLVSSFRKNANLYMLMPFFLTSLLPIAVIVGFFVMIMSQYSKPDLGEKLGGIKGQMKSKYFKDGTFDCRLVGASQREAGWLKQNGFETSKVIRLETLRQIEGGKRINLCVDDKNLRFVFDLGNNVYSEIYNWSDIVSVNVREKKKEQIVDDRNDPRYRYYQDNPPLFNVFGEVRKKTIRNCENLFLEIKVMKNNMANLFVVYNYTTVNQGTEKYAQMKSNADKVSVMFENFIETARREFINYKYNKESYVFCTFCGFRNSSKNSRCSSCGAPLPKDLFEKK